MSQIGYYSYIYRRVYKNLNRKILFCYFFIILAIILCFVFFYKKNRIIGMISILVLVLVVLYYITSVRNVLKKAKQIIN